MHKAEHDKDEALALAMDAKFFCHRACHDAMDAATAKITRDFTTAISKFGPEIVALHFSKFSEFQHLIFEARRKIAASRKDRENRELIYQTIRENDLSALIVLYNEFITCEPHIREAALRREVDEEQRRRDAQRNLLLTKSGIALSIASIVIGLILGLGLAL